MFEVRSDAAEIMDDFALGGEAVGDALGSIEWVNRWLGGTRVLVGGVERALVAASLDRVTRPLVVHDLGCGGADGLRALARWGRQTGRVLRLTGVDASPACLAFARERSRAYPEITFDLANILSPAYRLPPADVVTFNLCLHHFVERDIVALLDKCRVAGVRTVVVNDLHRHWLAYGLFMMICRLLRLPRIARLDGLLSVRKGFTRPELEAMVRRVDRESHELRWKWAFRYQLVLVFGRDVGRPL